MTPDQEAEIRALFPVRASPESLFELHFIEPKGPVSVLRLVRFEPASRGGSIRDIWEWQTLWPPPEMWSHPARADILAGWKTALEHCFAALTARGEAGLVEIYYNDITRGFGSAVALKQIRDRAGYERAFLVKSRLGHLLL